MASQDLESATEKALSGTRKDGFSSPVSSTKVQEVRKQGVPKKTAAQTGWAVRVWVDWAKLLVNLMKRKGIVSFVKILPPCRWIQ